MKRGGATESLARTFFRAWQFRFAVVTLTLAVCGIVLSTAVSDSLQLTPTQRADSVMGASDAYMQLAGAAPIGTAGDSRDADIIDAVVSAGGERPMVDHATGGLRADGDDETAYALQEFDDIGSVAPRLTLLSGEWPDGPGEVAVSQAIAEKWPIGSVVSFLNGGLTATVTGSFENRFDHSSRLLVLGHGTWSTIDEAAASLAGPANLNLRWSGDAPSENVRAAALAALAEYIPADSLDRLEEGAEVQTRQSIESTGLAPNVTLRVAQYAVPLGAGLISGILAGSFAARVRAIMWTVGVPYRQTRRAAYRALVIASVAGAVLGAVAGIALSLALRPLMTLLANTDLGSHLNLGTVLAVVPVAVFGAVFGMVFAHRQPRRAMATDTGAFDRALWLVTATVVLIALGMFIGTGATSVSTLTLSGLLVAAGAVVISVPGVLALLRVATHASSPATRLALRKLTARGGGGGVITISLLQVLGCALAIFVTSVVTDINASTESQVPPGQIVFQPESADSTRLRGQFEVELGLATPIEESTLAAGNERADGATRAIASVADLEQIIQVGLTDAQRSTLEKGGMLVVKPLDGATTVVFPSDGRFPQAEFEAVELEDIDPSFRNISGFVLNSTAEAAGIPLVGQAYVYVDVTPQQQATARSVAQQLSINPTWVSVYKAPDEIAAPLGVVAIGVTISAVTALILLLLTTSQVRQLRPDLAGLRAVGVGSAFLKRVVFTRVVLTVALSATIAVGASALGVSVGFSVADLSYGVTIPLIPILSMLVSFGLFGLLIAAMATRRVDALEWADGQTAPGA